MIPRLRMEQKQSWSINENDEPRIEKMLFAEMVKLSPHQTTPPPPPPNRATHHTENIRAHNTESQLTQSLKVTNFETTISIA